MLSEKQASASRGNRSGEVRIGELWAGTSPLPIVDADTTLREASKLLQSEPDRAGLLVRAAGSGGYEPLFRVRAFVTLAQPYLKDLYYHRSLGTFLKQHHAQPALALDCSVSVGDAIEAALARPPETRYDPILLRKDNEPPRMVDVRVLLEHQRQQLTHAIHEVDRQRSEARIASLHDRLTGLPNRPHAMDRLERMSQSCRDGCGCSYAVLFLDFDRFKLINDSLGHDAGDELLVQISRRLHAILRKFTGKYESDGRWQASRLGGDEFLVLLDNIDDEAEAQSLAQAIVDGMRPTFNLRGIDVTSSPSIGIATCNSSDGSNPQSILRDADVAMYAAKAQGRNQYVLFDQSMHDASLHRLNLETQLRSALEKRQFTPYYQPIVSCESGEIAGFEALIRWDHPELGRVSPAQFIPVAEECGLIGDIGRFMIEQALRQLSQWQQTCSRDTPLYMSVNVSKRQLLMPGCLDHLELVLQETGVEPGCVYLEVTETVVMDQADAVIPILNQIKQLGVHLSMDDFGTGLSSLTYLHQYPVEVLKIDQSFVKHLETDTMYTAVVQAIVTLAKNLKMSIVVEGIERLEQLAQIQALDCEYAQGYLFSKPLPAEEAGRLLTGRAITQPKHAAA